MSSRPAHDWHLDDRALRAYADGDLDFAAEASVEAHLLACAACRSLAAPVAEPARLDARWAEVVDRLDAPRQTLLERFLVRLGVADSTARLLGSTPSLTTSWLGAVAVALFFALVAAHSTPAGTLVFLLLAPVLPVAGVAAAYGRHVDPAYDIGQAAPYSSFRLLLLRSSAVLVTTAVLAGVAAALLPAEAWLAAAWLLPALALTTATLALSVRYDATWSALGVAAAWGVLVVGPIPVAGFGFSAFAAPAQLAFLAVAVLSTLSLVGHGRSLTSSSGRTL